MSVQRGVNCFTIAAGGTLTDGVPLARGILLADIDGETLISLGEHCTVSLGENDQKHYLPELESGRLVRAKLIFTGAPASRPRLVFAPAVTRSLIVHIICSKLEFDFKSFADGLNLWPGGDGHIRAFRQFGEHKNGLDKQQLFEVPNGKSIFVIDQFRAVVRLTCVDGSPAFSRPDIPELVEFLCERAKAQRKIQALDWSLYNLRALAKQREHAPLLRRAIAEIGRLRDSA